MKCAWTKGLTGKQGVMIPQANVNNLMLRQPVIQAVSEGKFHIYQVSRVEQGIEILTGVAAGSPDDQGVYPAGTLYGAVQQKLHDYWQRAVKFKKDLEALETE